MSMDAFACATTAWERVGPKPTGCLVCSISADTVEGMFVDSHVVPVLISMRCVAMLRQVFQSVAMVETGPQCDSSQ